MKQFKMTVTGVALLLGTFGVFAGKPAFLTGLYAKKGTTAIHIANTVDFTALQVTPFGSQVTITDHLQIGYPLYAQSNLTVPLYEISVGW
jgi:hypothetical protein